MSGLVAQSGIEPPSGMTGDGSINMPYDAGNAHVENTGTETNTEEAVIRVAEVATAPSKDETPPSATLEGMRAGASILAAVEKGDEYALNENKSEQTIGAAVKESTDNFGPATGGPGRQTKRNMSEQRDVSPGTMPDGSHAETSGDRGEGYEPGKKSKIKSVFGFGKH